MKLKSAAIQAALSIVVALLGSVALGQTENGLKGHYAELSDLELWGKVLECETRGQILSLLNEIPLSVMVRHATAALESPKKEPSFGNLVTQVVWTELSQNDEPSPYCDRFLKSMIWKSASGKYEVKAQLFDVKQEGVVLRSEDGLLVEVPLKRLSRPSQSRLKEHLEFRQNMADQVPEDISQLSNLIETRMAAVINGYSRPKLLKTVELRGREPSAIGAQLSYDESGTRLIVRTFLELFLLDVGKGREIDLKINRVKMPSLPVVIQEPHEKISTRFVFRRNLQIELVDVIQDKVVHTIGTTAIDYARISENEATVSWAFKDVKNGSPSIEILDTSSGKITAFPDLHGPFWLSEDGARLLHLSQPESETMKYELWDIATKKLIGESTLVNMANATAWATEIAPFLPVSHDCSWVVMSTDSSNPGLLEVATGNVIELNQDFLRATNKRKSAIFDFAPDRRHLMWVAEGAIVRWDRVNPEVVQTWKRPEAEVVGKWKTTVDDSKLAFLTVSDASLSQRDSWPVEAAKRQFDEMQMSGLTMSFGCGDGLELWDLDAGRQLAGIATGDDEVIIAFDFNPNGRHVATMNITVDKGKAEITDRTIKIWRLPK